MRIEKEVEEEDEVDRVSTPLIKKQAVYYVTDKGIDFTFILYLYAGFPLDVRHPLVRNGERNKLNMILYFFNLCHATYSSRRHIMYIIYIFTEARH